MGVEKKKSLKNKKKVRFSSSLVTKSGDNPDHPGGRG